MISAGIGAKNYQVTINDRQHSFFADEPTDKGGEDSGPTPDELLEAALASCTAITLKMYISRKQWPVNSITVSVKLERTDDATVFTRDIAITGDINEEQRTRLLQIAKACPVSKTLHGQIEINSAIS